jgi:hypothetical protein
MKAHRPALILLFAKKFFRGSGRTGTYQRFGFAARTRTQVFLTGSSVAQANEVDSVEYSGSWLNLAPAFTPAMAGIGPWALVSSYSSATASGFHGISRADPLF